MASKKRSARALFEGGLGFAKFVDRLPGKFATMPPNVNVLISKYLSQRASPHSWLAQWTMPNFPSNASAQPGSHILQEEMSAHEADLSRALALAYGLPRFPIGTDASDQYASEGMASAWLPSSSNQYLSSMRYIPDLLRALANYGMPIAPALAASVSGSTPDTLNTAAEASRRSIGILPSLQTLTGLTQSEQEMLRGYIEGVGGLPWADTVDFIAKMTSNLQSPQRARGGG
jgi:hypothetical protein